MKISIIIPTRNEEAYIGNVLESIIHQDYLLDEMEILVVDGMSTDKTCEIVQQYANNYSFINLLNNPLKTAPHALNLGIEKAQGELIFRMDAHASYPSNYISELIKQMELNNADNVGGVIQTLAGNNSNKAKAIAESAACIFGVGNSLFRISAPTITQVDTVPFGCFKKELFAKIGLFDEDLTRNQDDEFNARIVKNGGKIFLIPQVKVKYYARQDLKSLSRMFFQYGYFKPLVNKKIGKPTSIRQLFPPAFIILLVLNLSMPFINLRWAEPFFALFFLYLLLDVYFSLSISIHKKKLPLFPWLMLIFPLLHIIYGVGYIWGLPHLWNKQHKTSLSSFEISR